MLTLSHYVNGKHTETSQRQQPIYEPASGELRGHVSLACKQEVSNAIEIAKQHGHRLLRSIARVCYSSSKH